MMKMEFKSIPFELTNLDYEGRTIEGYASVFGVVDLKGDVVHPGAFRKTLEERSDQIRFLWQHDVHEPIGRFLELKEDSRGLHFKAVISETSRGKDALALFKDGAINEFSIGYDAIASGTSYERKEDGTRLRHLKEIRLWCISAVTFAMNPEAVVTAIKSLDVVTPGEELRAEVRLIAEGYQDVDIDVELTPVYPDEAKRVDVTENTIRIRVRPGSDFKEGSYKTITVSKSEGIKALIGQLKGKSTTAIQTYIFDKSKWTKSKAEDWVSSHKKEMDFTALTRNVYNVFHATQDNSWQLTVGSVRENDFVVSSYDSKTGNTACYLVPYTYDENGENLVIADRDEWKRVRPTYEEVPDAEEPVEAKNFDTELMLAEIQIRRSRLRMLGQAD